MKKFKLLAVILLVLVAAAAVVGCSEDESIEVPGSIAGELEVRDAADELDAGAEIEITIKAEDGETYTTTVNTESGDEKDSYAYKLEDVAAGTYDLTVDAEGYTGDTEEVTVESGQEVMGIDLTISEKVNAINVTDVDGATVTTAPDNEAKEGDEVTVEISDIEDGKEFSYIEVTSDDSEKDIETSKVTEGEEYTFDMPDEAVTVEVTLGLEGSCFAGGYGTEGNPYQIKNANQLKCIEDEMDAHYELIADIVLTDWDDYSDSGFEPIGYVEGDDYTDFTGSFDGDGHVISGGEIYYDDEDYIGVFAHNSGVIKNVGVEDVDVTGESLIIGGLAGYNRGDISNSSTTGDVTGDEQVGGLVGSNGIWGEGGTISSSYATGNVTGDSDFVGGLVGDGGNDNSVIEDSYATGDVTGDVTGHGYVGGLVGYPYGGEISNCYATGDVTGTEHVGGLLGENFDTKLTDSYAAGNVTGSDWVGGLVGENDGPISNSYATGDVTGDEQVVGGLVGYNIVEIEDSYATGLVEGTTEDIGGLVGTNDSDAEVIDSMSLESNDYEVIGNDDGTLTGRVTDAPESDMQDEGLYTDDNFESYDALEEAWDSSIWNFGTDSDYPKLDWQE